MTNDIQDNNRLRAIELLLESFDGEPAPYDLSRSVAYIRKNLDNFEKATGWSKASKMVEFLQELELARETRDSHNAVKIQPIVALKQWREKLDEHFGVYRINRDVEEIDADAYGTTTVKFQNITDFVEIFNKYRISELYFGKAAIGSMTEYGHEEIDAVWFTYYTTIYSYPRYDIANLNDIVLLMKFDLDQQILDELNTAKMEVISDGTISEYYLNILTDLRHFDKEIYEKYKPESHSDDDGYATEHLSADRPVYSARIIQQSGFVSAKDALEAYNDGFLNKRDMSRVSTFKENHPSVDHERAKQIVFAGFNTLDTFEEAQNKGFFLAAEYKEAQNFGIEHATQFRDIKNKEYPDYESYLKGEEQGYKNYHEYQIGTRAGFDSAEEYRKAKEGGFNSSFEWKEAKNLGLSTIEEYHEYIDNRESRLKEIKPILLKMIGMMRNAAYSLQQLRDVIEGKVEASLTDIDLLMQNDEDFQEHGTYDPNLRFFYKGTKSSDMSMITGAATSSGSVIVDVANVAWDGAKERNGNRPRIKNVELMMTALERRGIDDAIFLAKANLKHLIDNKARFQEYIENGIIKETPAGTDDDEYILKTALRTNSKIVSNDLFRDWQKENPKVADKIQELSTKYSIEGDIVNFDGTLDDWLRNPKTRYQQD